MKKLIIIILLVSVSLPVLSADRYLELKEPYNTISKMLHFGRSKNNTAPVTNFLVKSLQGWVKFAFEWYRAPYTAESFHAIAMNRDKVVPLLEKRLLGLATYEDLLSLSNNKYAIEQHIIDHIGDIPLTPYIKLLQQKEYKKNINISLGYEHSMLEDFDLGGSYSKGENYIHTIARKWANDRIKNIMLYITVRPQIMNYVNEKDSKKLKEIKSEEVVKILKKALYDYNFMVILEHLYK